MHVLRGVIYSGPNEEGGQEYQLIYKNRYIVDSD